MLIHRYIDMYPHGLGIKYKNGDMLYIFQMWIPRYIDMNPHFSQKILNEDIFRMCIHRYKDMYPHSLDNSFLVFNVQRHLRNEEKYSGQHILDRNVR